MALLVHPWATRWGRNSGTTVECSLDSASARHARLSLVERVALRGSLGASSLGPAGVAGAGTPADAVDTASLGGGDFGLLQQGGQGDMLESRRATPRRARASRDLRSSTSGQLPSSGPIAYLPPLARSFSHLWWSPHLFPRRFFSVRTATTTPRALTAPPRLRRELLLGALSSDWRPPYGQQDLNHSSARLV